MVAEADIPAVVGGPKQLPKDRAEALQVWGQWQLPFKVSPVELFPATSGGYSKLQSTSFLTCEMESMSPPSPFSLL